MRDGDKLTPADIHRIAGDISEGMAESEDARRLMQHFCDCMVKGEKVPDVLLEHFKNAFRAYLHEGKSIEAALGITRKRGRPAGSTNPFVDNTGLAYEIARSRLSGASHQNALEQVERITGVGQTAIGAAWARHKMDVWIELRIERELEGRPWTDEEIARLEVVFLRENR
jgi:membrane-bound lytic murein transglycosylase B